jgi:hypothetical protein
MRISLLPNLTGTEKEQLSQYLTRLLDNERLCEAGTTASTRYPLDNTRLGLYVDGRWMALYRGVWQMDIANIYIGQDNRSGNAVPLLDRVGIIAGIIAVAGLWTDELVEKFGQAVSRVMLTAYNEMMHGLLTVQGNDVPATGLAFSADRSQVAALMGSQYFTPNGQPVEVDESWVIVQ